MGAITVNVYVANASSTPLTDGWNVHKYYHGKPSLENISPAPLGPGEVQAKPWGMASGDDHGTSFQITDGHRQALTGQLDCHNLDVLYVVVTDAGAFIARKDSGEGDWT